MDTLRKLRVTYQTEIELLWRWRLGRRALLKRAVLSLLVSILAFYLTAWLLPGLLSLENLGSSILAILFISVVNLLVRPGPPGLAHPGRVQGSHGAVVPPGRG